MQRKQMFGSVALALGLLSGPSLASYMEPTPPEQLKPITNPEAKIIPASLGLALRDSDPTTDESPEDGFLPDLPILVDGKLYSAEELQEGGILVQHYVLDARSAEMNVVQGFRSTDTLKAYLDKTGQLPSESPTGRNLLCNVPGQFFEHGFYGGARFSVYPGQALSSLGGFWNDRISSLWASPCSSLTVLFEHDNFRGMPLWIGRGWAIPTLAPFGWLGFRGWWPTWYSWNDRASSVIAFAL